MSIKKTTISATLLGITMIGLSGCGRTGEFKSQAKLGQPIVRAIEDYHTQTGSYPPSLDALPQKYSGWTYETFTNGTVIFYALKYRIGQGDVEYEPSGSVGGSNE